MFSEDFFPNIYYIFLHLNWPSIFFLYFRCWIFFLDSKYFYIIFGFKICNEKLFEKFMLNFGIAHSSIMLTILKLQLLWLTPSGRCEDSVRCCKAGVRCCRALLRNTHRNGFFGPFFFLQMIVTFSNRCRVSHIEIFTCLIYWY